MWVWMIMSYGRLRPNMKRKLIILLTAICMLCTMTVPAFGAENPDASKLNNPRISGGIVTWDCVQFGSYPQSVVKESDDVYQMLKSMRDWDENNDIVVNGNKYHRTQPQDEDGNVIADSPWGYYKYDPIQWRVLSVSADEALLISDKNLDERPYNEAGIDDVTWETSTIRSWLNGYGKSTNMAWKDYASNNFAGIAFMPGEREAINQKIIQNPDNSAHGTEGGNPTEDKIFFLSIEEVMDPTYGFPSSTTGTKTRRAVNTGYTASKSGMNNEGFNDYWWLRSPGHSSYIAAYVHSNGRINRYGTFANDFANEHLAVRPVLFLNLNSEFWSFVGTISGDIAASLSGITVSKIKKTYEMNETLNVDDLTVTACYDDGSRKTVTNYTTNASAIDMTTPGRKTLTVTYTEGTITKKASNIIRVKRQKVNPTPSISVSGSNLNGTIVEENNEENAKTTKPTDKPKKPKTVTLKKVSFTKKGTLKLTWKHDTKATGYQAMVATDKNFKKNKKTATIKKNKTVSKTFTKLKRKKTYYAKVRAYKQMGKTKVYGSYSKVKKAKVK